MGDAQPAAGPSAVPWQAWPCREGNLNPSLLQHQGEMVKISLFFRGGKKNPPQPCLTGVFTKVCISARDRLLGLQVISVWTYGSGRLYFGQLCGSCRWKENCSVTISLPPPPQPPDGDGVLMPGSHPPQFPSREGSSFAIGRGRKQPQSPSVAHAG